jgi:D-xylonolactonase
MMMVPEIVADYRNIVGEGPLWHPEEKRLYWVDIMGGKIFRLDPATGEHALFWQGDVLGGFTFQADGTLLLFMEKGAIAVLRDGQLSYLIDELPGEGGNRFNDVIADPAGRVFCGTMSVDDRSVLEDGVRGGTLYRLDTDGSITALLDDCAIPNGMGFTADRKHMYYTESMDHTIYKFDFDERSGEITNKRPFVETGAENGVPDGMTVDAEGHVWSARAFGSALYRYSPEGEEEMSVPFPTELVSSVAFGGEGLTDIYCTTIAGDGRDDHGPGAGALFRLRTGIKGVPDYYSRIGLA